MSGNDRWDRNHRQGDLTGRIGRELAAKAKQEREKEHLKRQREITQQLEEIEAEQAAMPVAYENIRPGEIIIDFTEEGGYHGVPANEYYSTV